MDFKGIGSRLIGVTALLAVISIIANLIFHTAITQQQEPGTAIALVFRLVTYVSLALMVVCAVITAIREQQLSKVVLPVLFGLVSIVLVVTGSDYAFSVMVATYLSSLVVFGGEKTEPVWQKNTVILFGLIGLVSFNVGLAATVTQINTVSMIGVLLGVTGFVLALIYPIQQMQWSWIILLLAVAATGLPLFLLAGRPDVGLLLLPMTAITAVRGLVWNTEIFDRRSFGAMAGLAVLMIIGGGTLINSIFSTVTDNEHPLTKPTFFAGIDMYLTAGVLLLIAWVFSFLYAARSSMWGWFASSLLLPGIGAILLGFFGPTAEDYQQGRASAAAKRQAGA